MKPITLKELQKLKQPFPYQQVAEQLNNLSENQLDDIDAIIAKAEQNTFSMVGIKKLFKMITNNAVKQYMKSLYNL